MPFQPVPGTTISWGLFFIDTQGKFPYGSADRSTSGPVESSVTAESEEQGAAESKASKNRRFPGPQIPVGEGEQGMIYRVPL